jgi:hypothetical protein
VRVPPDSERARTRAAGSGDGKFALYSTRSNRYLVYKGSLRWQETRSSSRSRFPPGGTKQNPLRFDGPLSHCDQILVELDTTPNLKFQVLQGTFPNDDVFANDRKTMLVRYTGGGTPRPSRPRRSQLRGQRALEKELTGFTPTV